MRVYLSLVRRELAGYFSSLTGYVIIAVVLLLLGGSFYVLIELLHNVPTDMPLTEIFYESYFFWLIFLLAAPVITMRTFALEKYSGTYETLMTTPVGDGQVVLAKFTSSLLFFILIWLPLLGCILFVRRYTNDPAALDLGPVASTFLGIVLLGCVYMSLGCFASALTRSQIIAAIISLALGMVPFLLSFLAWRVAPQDSLLSKVLQYISMVDHMHQFTRGVVDTRFMVFYLSLTALFLFLTLKVVESRRWK